MSQETSPSFVSFASRYGPHRRSSRRVVFKADTSRMHEQRHGESQHSGPCVNCAGGAVRCEWTAEEVEGTLPLLR